MSHPARMAAVAWVGLMLTLANSQAASAQIGAPFIASGRQLQAADGDTVVVDGDDRVSLVRRRQAHVRVVADETAGTVLVIADWGTRELGATRRSRQQNLAIRWCGRPLAARKPLGSATQ